MKPHVAFQHSLAEQLAAIRRATSGVCAGDIEALHVWRVAVRRQRTLLRALPRKQARAIGAKALQDHWRAWSRRLGPVRDADVWCETLRDPAVRRELGATARGRAFLRAQHQRRKSLKSSLCRLLQSPRYARLVRQTETLLSRELPTRLGAIGAGRLTQSARRAFSRLLGQARQRARRISDTGTESDVHALRRQVRRARYLSDLGRKILPAASPKLRKRLLQVQTALGKAHDADVHLALLGSLPPVIARCVRGRIRRRRTEALRQFRRCWRELSKRL